jgi:hypothetical protein
VVFLAYPLKFIFNSTFELIGGTSQAGEGVQSFSDLRLLYIIYGAGLGTVLFGFFLMYYHAYRLRDHLKLTEAEIIITRDSVCRLMISITLCLVSIILASLNRFVYTPGFVYMLLGPALGFTTWWHGKKAQAAHRARPRNPR